MHGTYTSQAANDFDEFGFNVEQYNFKGFVAIPLKKNNRKNRTSTKTSRKKDTRLNNLNFKCTDSKAIIISNNSDKGQGKDDRLKFIISGRLDKGKCLMIYLEDSD